MRRLLTIGSALIGLPLWVAVLPFLLVFSALADLVSGLRRFPTVRLSVFVGVYLVHTWVALFMALWLWSSGGFGRNPKLDSHRRMQAWWAESLFEWAGRLLGLRLQWPDTADLPSGPFIVLSRHASMIDAILPAVLVTAKLDRFVHYVLKSELRWDPSLDVYGTRLGNHFVTRTGSQIAEETAAITTLAQRAVENSGLVIFPEGTYASAAALTRVRASLERAASGPDAQHGDRLRLDLAQRLEHLLPPKPSGTLALFDGAPEADIVMLGHVGLEGVGQLGEMRRRLPLAEPIEIRWWVHQRSELPTEPADQVGWLNDRWLELDRWVSTVHDNRS